MIGTDVYNDWYDRTLEISIMYLGVSFLKKKNPKETI
jgi:hypothetical protein